MPEPTQAEPERARRRATHHQRRPRHQPERCRQRRSAAKRCVRLQSQIGGLQSQINNVGRRLRDGVAVAMAAGGVPAVPTGRRIGVFGNIAAYDGHGAAGIGITASYMKPLATNSRPTARSVSASTRVLWVRVAGSPKDVKRLVVKKRHDRHRLSVRTTSLVARCASTRQLPQPLSSTEARQQKRTPKIETTTERIVTIAATARPRKSPVFLSLVKI